MNINSDKIFDHMCKTMYHTDIYKIIIKILSNLKKEEWELFSNLSATQLLVLKLRAQGLTFDEIAKVIPRSLNRLAGKDKSITHISKSRVCQIFQQSCRKIVGLYYRLNKVQELFENELIDLNKDSK